MTLYQTLQSLSKKNLRNEEITSNDIEAFNEFGITRSMNVGSGRELSVKETLEWYAGQMIASPQHRGNILCHFMSFCREF